MSNAAEMDAQEIINYIATAPKKTPVKLYVCEKPGMKVQWGNAHVSRRSSRQDRLWRLGRA